MSDKLPTRAEYDAATPRQKGFMAYTYSEWPGSKIPDQQTGIGEFPPFSKERKLFLEGAYAGMIAAQDSEE